MQDRLLVLLKMLRLGETRPRFPLCSVNIKTDVRDVTIGTEVVPMAVDAAADGGGVLLDSYSF